jgi:hypothetical protein
MGEVMSIEHKPATFNPLICIARLYLPLPIACLYFCLSIKLSY